MAMCSASFTAEQKLICLPSARLAVSGRARLELLVKHRAQARPLLATEVEIIMENYCREARPRRGAPPRQGALGWCRPRGVPNLDST